MTTTPVLIDRRFARKAYEETPGEFEWEYYTRGHISGFRRVEKPPAEQEAKK